MTLFLTKKSPKNFLSAEVIKYQRLRLDIMAGLELKEDNWSKFVTEDFKKEIAARYKKARRGFLAAWTVCILLLIISSFFGWITGVYLLHTIAPLETVATSPPIDLGPNDRAQRLGLGLIVTTSFTFAALFVTFLYYLLRGIYIDHKLGIIKKRVKGTSSTGTPSTVQVTPAPRTQ